MRSRYHIPNATLHFSTGTTVFWLPIFTAARCEILVQAFVPFPSATWKRGKSTKAAFILLDDIRRMLNGLRRKLSGDK